MLATSSFGDSASEGMMEISKMDEFSDMSGGTMFEYSIDFDELFAGLDDDSDVLPELEILGDYSIDGVDEQGQSCSDDGNGAFSGSGSGCGSGSGLETSSICSPGEGVVDKAGEVDVKKDGNEGQFRKLKKPAAPAGRSKGRGCDGKRKVKVDWTPELHKRFVQAVEQLGEKAVPSRILEVMGTNGLTRHNIASHLQKYRSHRKHLIAREAEAASWNQRRRHMYGGARAGGIGKRPVASPWVLPTIGFPPPMPQPVHHHSLIRPLHVWGHPKHVAPHHMRLPHPFWAPPPHSLTQGMPCFPTPPQGFVTGPITAVPHQTFTGPLCSTPSNESIDAALEDVLAKPWLPLPLGLKPPAIDTVVGELQRRGVPQIPPS